MKRQRLESIVTGIKSSNKEYYKIKEKAKENMKSVLTNDKLLLKFATPLVIESVRTNTKLYNFAIYDISTTNNTITTSHESNSLSLMSGPQHQQSFNDSYTALILEEAEKLYNKLITKLTNRFITATATIMESSLPLPTYNNSISIRVFGPKWLKKIR